jgi:hypothetical protein
LTNATDLDDNLNKLKNITTQQITVKLRKNFVYIREIMMLTERLEQAFTKASKLSPHEQDELADWFLAELESEKYWEKLFADSQDVLSTLAAEALAEHKRGLTKELDIHL